MPTKYASQNETVQSIRNTLLEELEADKIFVEWKDKDAKMVKMIIEGHKTVQKEEFQHMVGEQLPHNFFRYETHPAEGKDWAETHILFHTE